MESVAVPRHGGPAHLQGSRPGVRWHRHPPPGVPLVPAPHTRGVGDEPRRAILESNRLGAAGWYFALCRILTPGYRGPATSHKTNPQAPLLPFPSVLPTPAPSPAGAAAGGPGHDHQAGHPGEGRQPRHPAHKLPPQPQRPEPALACPRQSYLVVQVGVLSPVMLLLLQPLPGLGSIATFGGGGAT